ncbi:MAG: hypothetical protein PVH95_06410, partial [Anaerolineae bacterium]
MLEKSRKAVAVAVVVVVMMGLVLVLTSALAAGASETGAMYRLDPGEQHWYTLTDQGNGGAQVGMNVALLYVSAEVNGALLASRALNRDANPSMNVALWYAPIEANGALLASRALN